MVRRKRNLEIIRNISGKEKQITFLRSTCYIFLHRRDHWKTRRKDSTRNFERIITSWGNFISLIIENREESAKNRKILENKNDSTQNRQILQRSWIHIFSNILENGEQLKTRGIDWKLCQILQRIHLLETRKFIHVD